MSDIGQPWDGDHEFGHPDLWDDPEWYWGPFDDHTQPDEYFYEANDCDWGEDDPFEPDPEGD